MKKHIKELKNNKNGISMIALIIIILVIIIILSMILGLITPNQGDNQNIENNFNATNNTNEEANQTPNKEPIIIEPGHKHNYSIVEKTTKATCTEQAKSYLKCECGSEIIEIESGSLGHSWNSGEITKKATCQQEGEITYTCTRCNEKRNEKTEKVLHDFTNKNTASNYIAEEASCTSAALYYYKCQNCEEHGENTYTYGESIGHKWNEGEITKEPTQKKEGTKTYTCTVCDETRTESIPVLK